MRFFFAQVLHIARTQSQLLVVRAAWTLNLAGSIIVFVFLMPRDPMDIYPQYQFQIAYPGVSNILSPEQLANIVLGLDYVVLGAFIGLAFFLVWRKPGDILSLFTSALFINIGVGSTTITYIESRFQDLPEFAWLDTLQFLLNMVGFFGLAVFIFVFPDGRFAPRIMRWVVLVYFVASLAGWFIFLLNLGDESYYFIIIDLAVLFLGALINQVYRYYFYATPIQRQQAKLVVFGSALSPVFGMTSVFLISPLIPVGFHAQYNFLSTLLGFLFLLIIPVTLTISILRYNLWEIDLIIRRTLQYSILTGLLALVYFSGVLLLQGVLTLGIRDLGPVVGDLYSGAELQPGNQSPDLILPQDGVGQPPALVIVLTTLAVAALFNPLRRRVQDFIDRRFYRQKYDAEKALAEFAALARNETQLDRLNDQIINTVQKTMLPEQVEMLLIKYRRDKS